MSQHVAQINLAKSKWPAGSAEMDSFISQLATINQLAEESEGFVWRHMPQPARELALFGEGFLVNMSVWESLEHLKHFTYISAHKFVMQDRKKWFESFEAAHFTMWFIDPGTTPSLIEAKRRLDHLTEHGESEYAFTFRSKMTL